MTRVAVIRSDHIKPDWEAHPKGWDAHGTPDLMLIDADNDDHWKTYVWSFVADNPEYREELIAHSLSIPARTCGYEIGYYPIDIEDWEMVPIGPFCAECITPAHGYSNPIDPAKEDYPQAYMTELIEGNDDDDTCCSGCGAVLHRASNDE